MSESPAPSTWLRWLPTALGLAVALATVAVYELGPSPASDADCPPAAEQDARSANEPRFAGAARATLGPSPSRTAEAELEDLRGQLTRLETQTALIAERSISGELAYHDLSQPELEALARHCEVRVDYPTRLDEQAAADLGLETGEVEAWERALQRFAGAELESYRELLATLEPEASDLAELSLVEIRRRLRSGISRARTSDEAEMRQRIAEERAGLREPPVDTNALGVDERLARLRFDAGERFADELASELGAERSEELRRAFAGWPGARTRERGCPGG